MIDRETIIKVTDRAQIEDIVADDIQLKKCGTNYRGLCPFHNDHTPSFNVSPSKNICKCFVCGVGGNPVSYYMKKNGAAYPETIKALAKRYDIEIREEEESKEEKELRLKKEKLIALNERVFVFYGQQLKDYPDVMEYLKQRFNEEFINEYDVAYAPNVNNLLLNWAKKNKENLADLQEIGWLKVNDRTGRYEDSRYLRIIFPIRDLYGRMVGYTARTIGKDKNTIKKYKYLNSCDSIIYNKLDYVVNP